MRGRLVAALCLSPDVLHGLLRPTPMATRRTDRPTDFLILSFLFVALSVPCQDQVLHAPFTWRDWESLSKHSYMERFTIYHVNRVYMLGLSGLHAPFRFYMD